LKNARRNGKILGFKNFKNEFHEVIAFHYLSSSEFCASCHRFNFPKFIDKKVRYSNEPMQNTYNEWKKSRSFRICQSCHYEGHRLLGSHNPERLKKDFSSIEYEFLEKGLLWVRINFKQNRAHTLPTGDLSRSIQLEISKDKNYKKIYYRKKWARQYGIGKVSGNTLWNRSLIKNSGIRQDENYVSIIIDSPPKNINLYARLVYYLP
jgi:hypothetical protein